MEDQGIRSEETGASCGGNIAQAIDGIDRPQILKPYAYHRPSDESLKKITELRLAFSRVDEIIKAVCLSSRERSEAITCLENAAMWAIKSVVFNDSDSIAETN